MRRYVTLASRLTDIGEEESICRRIRVQIIKVLTEHLSDTQRKIRAQIVPHHICGSDPSRAGSFLELLD